MLTFDFCVNYTSVGSPQRIIVDTRYNFTDILIVNIKPVCITYNVTFALNYQIHIVN